MPKKVPKSIRLSSKARKMLTIACAILVFLFALGITLYPLISNWYNSRHQSEIHTQYLEVLRQVDNSEIIFAERYANEYNAAISPGTQLSDAFSKEALLWASEDYENLLNLAGDGIMGYIEIPMIQVNLPIYHGTDSKTLDIGVGHLLGSSLPVGGKGTHTVLTGHSGMATQKMFSDLDKLKLGDVFYLQVLDETLAYQVDAIHTVLPYDTSFLGITEGEDYCTLVTCTPFGINTHRLLVRGTRIPYEEAEVITAEKLQVEDTPASTWEQQYIKGILNTFYQMVTMFDISVDQYFYPSQNSGSECRKRIDAMLNALDERELKIVEATIQAMKASKETEET